MKHCIILYIALLAAGIPAFFAEAHGPHDHWGYSGRKPAIYCVIPGPHGERPGMDRYSHSVVLVSVDGNMKRKDMEKLCRTYDLSILYEYKNFSMYALQTEGNQSDEEMNRLVEELEKKKASFPQSGTGCWY